MTVVFAHDHVFHTFGGRTYTSGSFPDSVLGRYTRVLGPLRFVARVRADAAQPRGLSRVTDPDVTVVGTGSAVAGWRRIDAEVAAADAVVVRLPSRVGALAWLSARRRGKPCLVEVVGCAWDAYWHHSRRGRVLAPAFYALTRAIVRRSSHVLYVTDAFLQRRYPSAGVTLACSDVQLPEPDAVTLERRLARIAARRPSEPLILATAGAVHVGYKGHEYVLRAQRLLKDRGIATHYWVMGGGDPTRLRGLVEELGLSEDVTLLGSLPHADVLARLRHCDVYVQPSRVEGLPRALLEAMSVGCPALGSRVGGIPELLGERDLFPVGGVAALADRLAGLDAATLATMARENHELAATHYHPRRLADERDAFLAAFAGERVGAGEPR